MNTKFNGPSELMVTRNSSVNRFEVTIEGHLAKVEYRMSGNRMIITHMEVPDTLRSEEHTSELQSLVDKNELVWLGQTK